MSKEQIHLIGRHMSGRGVRYRALTPDQALQVRANVYKTIQEGDRKATLDERVALDGITIMIREISEPIAKDKIMTPEAKWKPVKSADLDGNLHTYFTTRDIAMLCGIYERLHNTTDKEVDELMGEAIPLED